MRLEMLRKKIMNAGESNLKRLVAWGCLSWGVSKSTMGAYLEILMDADMIDVSEALDLVVWK